jgi:hypothetical protein
MPANCPAKVRSRFLKPGLEANALASAGFLFNLFENTLKPGGRQPSGGEDVAQALLLRI